MKPIICIVVLVWLIGSGVAPVQAGESPPAGRVRVTGMLLPPEAQQREDLVTATIFVHDKPWLFRVGKVEGLTGAEREQAVTDGALLEQVRFSGPDAVMRRLQKADLIGKPLIIEGTLDATARRFLVTRVEEAPDAAPSSR